jgi:hypothetical protein
LQWRGAHHQLKRKKLLAAKRNLVPPPETPGRTRKTTSQTTRSRTLNGLNFNSAQKTITQAHAQKPLSPERKVDIAGLSYS